MNIKSGISIIIFILITLLSIEISNATLSDFTLVNGVQIDQGTCCIEKNNGEYGVIISKIIMQRDGKRWVIFYTNGGQKTLWIEELEPCSCSEALSNFTDTATQELNDWLEHGIIPKR